LRLSWGESLGNLDLLISRRAHVFYEMAGVRCSIECFAYFGESGVSRELRLTVPGSVLSEDDRTQPKVRRLCGMEGDLSGARTVRCPPMVEWKEGEQIPDVTEVTPKLS
jgi:hypothetical protein